MPEDLHAPPTQQCDVAVIGAGPAGVMSAAMLHKAGIDVRVFEASRFPRFVIGESLLPRCMDLLEDADLLDSAQSQGYLVKNGAVFMRGNERCTFDFADQFTRGWGYTWQVPRAHFDEVLARAISDRGIPVHYEHRVEHAEVGEHPALVVRDPTGSRRRVEAKFIVDASGYGRVLPKILGLNVPSSLPMRRSVFAHVRGDRRPSGDDEGRIWVVINRHDAWTWVIPFSDGTTSVGVVGSPEFFEGRGDDDRSRMLQIFAETPHVCDRLADIEFVFEPRRIDGYSVGVDRLHGPNYCLVGNTTEFLDPVFSSGVTLALESAHRAASVVRRQLAGESVDWDSDYSEYLMGGVDCFRTYVHGWYDGTLPRVFFAPNPSPGIKRMMCSVLAGYVWDQDNPFVRDHAKKLEQLALVVSG